MRVIGQCHALLHENGVVRIQSDIRVGTRTDKAQKMQVCCCRLGLRTGEIIYLWPSQDKVRVVEELLAKTP